MDFIAKNFLVPIVFFLLFQAVGAKPAIAAAVLITLLQVIQGRRKGEIISPFFAVASFFTVGFGSIDLFLASPRFFRLEPFFQNALMGVLFGGSLIARRPLIGWFAESLPARYKPDFGSEGAHYLKGVTWVWMSYFFAKALLFLWLAFQVDLGRLVILRSLIGGSTLLLMVVGEIAVRRWRIGRRARSLTRPGTTR